MPVQRPIAPLTMALAVVLAVPTLAAAQTTGSAGAARFQQGYGAARSATQAQGSGMIKTINAEAAAMADRAAKVRIWPTRLMSSPDWKVPSANPKK